MVTRVEYVGFGKIRINSLGGLSGIGLIGIGLRR
jgi:hypothetical protein